MTNQDQPFQVSEYEREPVPEKALKGWKSFLGMYAGEHTAGTELMIGPLFLAAGVSAFDLLAGLFFGNLLAVASWRYFLVPIATKSRLTLYFQLEKISGKDLVIIYNLANGILFCFLAGAMITVSATAVGIPFNMAMPSLTDVYPTSISWVLIVLFIGAVISIIAAKGYDSISRFANVAAPWMIVLFIAFGLASARSLEVDSFSDFWDIWGEGSEPLPNQIKYTFWHVLFFSWFCNAAMHLGMSDLSVFRYAKHKSAGWTTASGMYLGHYIAWIAAGLLYALYLKSPEAIATLKMGGAPSVSPGPMAYNAIGISGLIVVIIAGWTTANPTIYRAGLAFQAIMPKVARYKVTLFAGAIATIGGVFPAFAMKLLDFVALYGFILAPVGAIVFFDFYFAEKAGIIRDYAASKGIRANWPVLMAWAASMGICFYMANLYDAFLSFYTFPAWVLCGMLYLLFSKITQKK